jgi:hypothetical protein
LEYVRQIYLQDVTVLPVILLGVALNLDGRHLLLTCHRRGALHRVHGRHLVLVPVGRSLVRSLMRGFIVIGWEHLLASKRNFLILVLHHRGWHEALGHRLLQVGRRVNVSILEGMGPLVALSHLLAQIGLKSLFELFIVQFILVTELIYGFMQNFILTEPQVDLLTSWQGEGNDTDGFFALSLEDLLRVSAYLSSLGALGKEIFIVSVVRVLGLL